MTTEEREFEERKMVCAARLEAFNKSPFWFTVWDITTKSLTVGFWLGFWFIVFGGLFR